ncbi:hypothetical protein [Aquimarina agarilytica]|uniref:hypothetical protein n=1 Tax=Aquimarina agarilytica TaxID=1087449 RepID=UPI000288CB5B|nr:hypothetical protein [Aquimarina agarilytica]
MLPPGKAQGQIKNQFYALGKLSGISKKQVKKVFKSITSNEGKVLTLVNASFLNEKTKRNYTQAYQTKLKKLLRD